MVRKPYKQLDRRYVVEYVNEKFPDRRFVWYNAAVGPVPEALVKAHPEVSLKHFKRWRRYADAIVIMQDRIILIEGELRRPVEGLGELLMYRDIIKQSPELKPYINLPLEVRLIIPRPDPMVINTASAQGIIVDVFYRDWVGDYLRELGLM